MTRRPPSAWMVWLILARLETENIEVTKSNILYRVVLFKNLACPLSPGRSAICCRLPGSTACWSVSGDVALGGVSTDTVSDVCTVKSLTVPGDTTLLANMVWARRAPTLSRCGAPVTLATHPLLSYGRGSVTVTGPRHRQWSCHFRALQLRSVTSQLMLSQSTAALLRWQVRFL